MSDQTINKDNIKNHIDELKHRALSARRRALVVLLFIFSGLVASVYVISSAG